ncbi:restriction endonuclease subunit S [Vibrio splendidus]|uniref:restriction endonuclease subunit S n=1 Tax=Vibrio splendidus TaxID=29497 RepID=UPI000D338759|nr:restriction endonuclease subunit S [Vibrio splendidus]PTO82880.1 restriction endonuclease subunit S [Vibrio splendidus]PTP77962.1 restriction endonuclease subunit S [Vibrio splendidus]
MGSEWKKAKLTEHYEIRSGLSKPAKDFGSGYPFLTFKNVFYNYFVPSELTELVQSTEKERAGCSVQRGDVFLTRTSETMNELGMSCVALKSYENSSFNGFCKRLRPKPESDLVPEYVGYYLRSPRFRNDMLAFSTMSTRASLNNDMIGRLDISYPSPESQRKVAHVLKSFDDKITINRQTNQTLEQMAQTLFKSWFVDFDPVKAKMNGEQPKGMDAATALLFPEKLVESELGLIPEGWEPKQLKEVLELAYGKALKKTDRVAGDVPVYGSGGLTGYHNQSLIEGPGIIVGRKGTVGSVYWEPKAFYPIDTVFYVKPKTGYSLKYCHLVLQNLGLKDMNTDAAVPGLNRNNAYRLDVITPSEPVLKKFEEMMQSFQSKVDTNNAQNASLESLRDTLLPKLLSGEIDLENLPVEQAKALAE